MTTPAKKPYHKKRHPWRNQDLRSDAKRAAARPAPYSAALPFACVICGAPVGKLCDGRKPSHVRAETAPPIPLCIEIVESATGKVEKKLGPFATERLRDKADDGLTRQLDHEHFYTRFAP